MTHLDIIRAWKDEEFWLSLSDEQRMMFPEHPAGTIELPPAQHMKVGVFAPCPTIETTLCPYKPSL